MGHFYCEKWSTFRKFKGGYIFDSYPKKLTPLRKNIFSLLDIFPPRFPLLKVLIIKIDKELPVSIDGR